ncbi:MAG: hypothetical protein E6J14_10120 [Chloroflexi bacterium]|nr:MAG: hypothetical protein E6J14_10120 [Chloroflexota bacterium]
MKFLCLAYGDEKDWNALSKREQDELLAGFSVIEARDLDEAIELVSKTPCAVARGAIEVRPLREW